MLLDPGHKQPLHPAPRARPLPGRHHIAVQPPYRPATHVLPTRPDQPVMAGFFMHRAIHCIHRPHAQRARLVARRLCILGVWSTPLIAASAPLRLLRPCELPTGSLIQLLPHMASCTTFSTTLGAAPTTRTIRYGPGAGFRFLLCVFPLGPLQARRHHARPHTPHPAHRPPHMRYD